MTRRIHQRQYTVHANGQRQFTPWHLERVAREELQGFHPRLLLMQLLLTPLPLYAGSRLRAYALRMAGFNVGHGTVIWGMPTITGTGDITQRLSFGRECWINIGCVLELGAAITIGDRVGLGHETMILTTTHDIGSAERRVGPPQRLPVTIGAGTWLCSRSTILPGVTIGAGAIVAAGSVVNRDVPPHTLVAGVPARAIKTFDA